MTKEQKRHAISWALNSIISANLFAPSGDPSNRQLKRALGAYLALKELNVGIEHIADVETALAELLT